jgi:hypothetical protein
MRCPVCKADNSQGPQCRRCKADLSALFALEEQRAQALAAAGQGLLSGQIEPAFRLAQHAEWLRRDVDSMRLLAMGALLQRDFTQAWRYYRLIQATGISP